MTSSDDAPRPERLSIIVPVEDVTPVGSADPEFKEHGVGEFTRRIFARAETLDLQHVRAQVTEIQDQVDELIEAVSARTIGCMHLSEVEIGLSLSAEGSIGIATVGAEASISLTYSYGAQPST